MAFVYSPAITPVRSAVYVPNTPLVQPVVAPQPVVPVTPMEMVPTYPTYPTYPAYPTYPNYSYMSPGAVVPVADAGPMFAERQYLAYPTYRSPSPRMNNVASNPSTIVNKINNNVTPIINTPPANVVRSYHGKRTKVVRFPRAEVIKPRVVTKVPTLAVNQPSGRRSVHVTVTAKGLGRRWS